MKYVVLVSHGTFAPGLHSVLKMLAGGNREDILSTSLEDGMSADTFGEHFAELIKGVTTEDQVILLADIIGGSPLTTSLNVLAEKGILKNTIAFGGMNLPMALTAAMTKDAVDEETFKTMLIQETKDAIKELELNLESVDDEDDI